MDMSQNYSLLPDNSDFPGKTKNKRSTQICLNYSLSNSLLSTLMIDVKKNISNWPDRECKDRVLAKIIHFYCIKGILKKKLKTTEANRYALSISPLSTLMRYLRNIKLA